MDPRLPSLNALRSLEAAARHGSLTRAADELHVTPSAVSHQIRQLEADLGVKLLRKTADGLAPTLEAEQGLPWLRDAFDALAEANRRLRRQVEDQTITVSAVPTFVSSWLVPRVDGFHSRHPGATVRFDTQWDPADFARDGVDLAIRYGRGPYHGLWHHKLMTGGWTPVATPGLVAGTDGSGRPPLRDPADLAHHHLLHNDCPVNNRGWPTWKDWLQAAGVSDRVDANRGTTYPVSLFADQAALAGQGVSLANTVLVTPMELSGGLVRPFDLVLDPGLAYWLVCPEAAREKPLVAAFIDWVLELVDAERLAA